MPVYFLEPKRKLSAVVNVSIRPAANVPVAVRIEHCGAAKARFVDPDGKPVVGRISGNLSLTMVVTPGPPFSTAKNQARLIAADEAELNMIDTVNYKSELVSDAEGRVTLPVLIPGATYRFIDDTMSARGAIDPQLRKEFTVRPGETLDLGDIRIEKPRT